jgi:hypothetical protein
MFDKKLPLLYDQVPMTVLATLKKDFKEGEIDFEMMDSRTKETIPVTLNLSKSNMSKGQGIFKLLAKKLLIEEEKIADKRDSCIELSKKYGVLSSYTSFFAYEKLQKEGASGEMELRKID